MQTDLDLRGVRWKNFRGVNFIHASGKPFDASNWPLHDSGLLGPVRLFRQEPSCSKTLSHDKSSRELEFGE